VSESEKDLSYWRRRARGFQERTTQLQAELEMERAARIAAESRCRDLEGVRSVVDSAVQQYLKSNLQGDAIKHLIKGRSATGRASNGITCSAVVTRG
jgi:hypothetical protein